MSQKPQRRTVRAAEVDRALSAQDAEIRTKITNVLNAYHARVVLPMALRLEELETPWWERMLAKVWRR